MTALIAVVAVAIVIGSQAVERIHLDDRFPMMPADGNLAADEATCQRKQHHEDDRYANHRFCLRKRRAY